MEFLIFWAIFIGVNIAIAKLGSVRMLLLGWAGGVVGSISGFAAGYLLRPNFAGYGQLSIAYLMDLNRQNATAQMKAIEPYAVETITFIFAWTVGLGIIGAITGMVIGGLTGQKKG